MKSLTWPRTRSVIWLCAGRPLNLSTSPAKFAGLGTITRSRKYNVSKLSCDYRIEVSREFFGTYSWWVSTLLKFGYTGIMKVEIYHFLFVTWQLGRCVTWLCGWGPLILSDHPASLGVHRPSGTGNNGVCNISSNPNSNSNAKVPMSRFTNGCFMKSFIEKLYKLSKSFIKRTCWYF